MIRVRWVNRPSGGRDDFAAAQASAVHVHVTLPVLDSAARVFARLVDAGETALANFRTRLDTGPVS